MYGNFRTDGQPKVDRSLPSIDDLAGVRPPGRKRKKYKKTIQVCTLSAFCLTAAIGGLIMENTYADEILLIPNVTQRESQSDTQSQNANNESYVQIISEDIKRTNSVGKEYFHPVD